MIQQLLYFNFRCAWLAVNFGVLPPAGRSETEWRPPAGAGNADPFGCPHRGGLEQKGRIFPRMSNLDAQAWLERLTGVQTLGKKISKVVQHGPFFFYSGDFNL